MNNTGNAEYQVKNCHGCKWLDRYKEDGRGYCSRVERSEQGKAHRRWLWEHREEFMLGRKEEPSVKVRTLPLLMRFTGGWINSKRMQSRISIPY